MRKKELEILLSRVPEVVFEERLEQYPTPASIAADVLWEAYVRGHVEGRVVADFGCGTGRFAYGVELLGGFPICLEIDPRLLAYATGERINADVRSLPIRRVDTVIQNPPFGTRRRRADRAFLEAAMNVADHVYTLHLRDVKNVIFRLAKDLGFSCHVLKDYSFPIRALYSHHVKRHHYIRVSLYLCERERDAIR